MRCVPTFIARRFNRISAGALWSLAAIAAVGLLMLEMQHHNSSTAPAESVVQVARPPKNFPSQGGEPEPQPVQHLATPAETPAKPPAKAARRPAEPVELDPKDPNNAPEPTHDKDYKATRTHYQWEWITSDTDNTIVLMDAFMVYRNSSGVSVAVLVEGVMSGMTFPTKTDYTTDYHCIWDDGTKSVPDVHMLYRQKQSEKRHIAYYGDLTKTLTKPFHDYFRTHRFICEHTSQAAVLKGLGRPNGWKATLKDPPIEMNPPTGGRISICMAPMFGSSNPRWLIEWFEYHRHAGVTRVHVPITHDASEGHAQMIWDVFRYYEAMGFAVLTPWSSQSSRRATEYQNIYERGKILAWNACYLQNRGTTDWLAFVDVDELISGNTPDVDLGPQLDFADSEWERTGLPGYALKSTTMAGVFNHVEPYARSHRLLLDEYSESELKQNCQARCGKYHQGRDKFMVRAGATTLPLEMMWTHAIGGSDYDYADAKMVQTDKSKIYLRHYNGWWLLQDRAGWDRSRGLAPLDWKPEAAHRRDAHIPPSRIYRMQRSIEINPKLKDLYMKSYAKTSPDWVYVLEERIEHKTYRPPWEVNSTCQGCNPPAKSTKCSVLYSKAKHAALIMLDNNAVQLVSLWTTAFPDCAPMPCDEVPAGAYLAGFIRDPVLRFLTKYETAVALQITNPLGLGGAPSLITDAVVGAGTPAAYWAKDTVTATFEKYVNEGHGGFASGSEWAEAFTTQAAVLRHFVVVDYLGRGDQDLPASWAHLMQKLDVKGDHTLPIEQPSTAVKIADLTAHTLDMVCGIVSVEMPCYQSKQCDMSWMLRETAHSTRNLLSTKISDAGQDCPHKANSFFEAVEADSGHTECRRLNGLMDRLQAADPDPDKAVMVVGCEYGYGAVEYYDRFDAGNVQWSRKAWQNGLAQHAGAAHCEETCAGPDSCFSGVDAVCNKTAHAHRRMRSPLVICIEPDPAKYAAISQAQLGLGWAGWHGGQLKSLFVVNAVLVDTARAGVTASVAGATINRTTVDNVMAAHDDLGKLDILTINVAPGIAEAHNTSAAKVLAGAYRTLRRDRVRLVEFVKAGNWAATSLREVTDTLDGLGFDCYWSGWQRLWAITSCWDERFASFEQSGTIACARRYDPWHEVMQELADE